MNKRTTIVVAVVALMVALFATAAYAATIKGTSGVDELFETPNHDHIFGYRGADFLEAYLYGDDTDKLYGGRGTDELDTIDNDGRDLADGGGGRADVCYGDPDDSFVRCEEIHTS